MKVRYDPGNGDDPVVYEVPDNATDDQIKSLGYEAYRSQQYFPSPKQEVKMPVIPKDEGIVPSKSGIGADVMDFIGDATQAGLRGLGKGLDVIDSYGLKPIQKGIYESAKNKDISQFPKAAYDQIGKSTENVPTTKQLLEDTFLSNYVPKHSVSEVLPVKKGGALDISTTGALGFVGDVLEDPTTYFPITKILKGTGKLASTSAKAANVPLEKMGLPKLPTNFDGASVTAKISHALSGMPENDIKTYINRNKEVKEQIAKHGKNFEFAADEYRSNLQKKVMQKKAEFNKNIEDAIEYFSAPPNNVAALNISSRGQHTTLKMVPTDKVKNSLLESRDSLNKILNPDEVKEIDDILHKIQRMEAAQAHTTIPGTITVKEMHQLKRELQEIGKSSYMKNGQIYARNDGVSRAAKNAAYYAKQEFDDSMLDIINKNNKRLALATTDAEKKMLEQEIGIAAGVLAANKNHHVLHSIDDAINKKLFKVGEKPNQLFLTGAGYNPQQEKQLQHLGTILGEDIVDPLKVMSSANTMSKLPLLPLDTTGKSATRVMLGAGGLGTAGRLVAGPTGGVVGGAMGATLASPLVQKSLIDMGIGAKNLATAGFKIPGTEQKMSTLKLATRAQKSSDENKRPTPAHVISYLSQNPQYKDKANVLQNALNRSEQSYGATYYLMYLNDEDFRRAMSQINQ